MSPFQINAMLSDADAARFEGHNLMLVPLAGTEISELRETIIGIKDLLDFNRKALATLQEVLETAGDRNAQVSRTLQMMLEPAQSAVVLHDRMRLLLGRAVFIQQGASNLEPRGPLQ
ncbi:MAG: hypothetical protein Q8O82_14645 [Pseudorhodobacter sp.]|nr:hypothetical protein [Pseudorhodobacter sp.]